MRWWFTFFLVSALAIGQSKPAAPAGEQADAQGAGNTLTIPAGTRIPVALKQAISTKNARQGDPVYAATAFPFVLNDRVVVPAGTYVQGRIMHVQRAGRVHGRAEVLIHFTSLIFPTGYTVMLPGAVENVPGADKGSIKDSEGTVRQDSQTAQKVGTVATSTGTGAVLGRVVSGSGKGAAIGAGVGGAAGAAIALLTRGNDLKLDAGSSIEMVIQRAIKLDGSRIGGGMQALQQP